MGIEHLIVVVNKMDDSFSNYTPSRFEAIKQELQSILASIVYPAHSIPFIPVSAQNKDNITKKSATCHGAIDSDPESLSFEFLGDRLKAERASSNV